MRINQDFSDLTCEELAAWLDCIARELKHRQAKCLKEAWDSDPVELKRLTKQQARHFALLHDVIRTAARHLAEPL